MVSLQEELDDAVGFSKVIKMITQSVSLHDNRRFKAYLVFLMVFLMSRPCRQLHKKLEACNFGTLYSRAETIH